MPLEFKGIIYTFARPYPKMENVKKPLLLSLAILVLLLATGGDYVNTVLKTKAQVVADMDEGSEDTVPKDAVISMDIFNSTIQVAQLVFHSDLIAEFNLPEIHETKAHSIFGTTLNITEFHKTLFRSIISPNAP